MFQLFDLESLLAGVLVELGTAAGLVLPLIAVHLFVFYFGILADDTPPVCLAAFAAAAISRADPIQTGIQGFIYDIRTAILPFIFIFNPELLLVGVTSVWHGLMIFVVSLIALLSFSSLTQGWFLIKLKWHESLLLVVIIVALFSLRMYTRDNAWFIKEESALGSIEVGKSADLVVLSGDYFNVPDEEIRGLKSLLTIVDGEIVYDSL